MALWLKRRIAIAAAIGFVTALAACQAAPESKEPIEWKISWAASTTHQDKTPLTAPPSYELEMATDDEQGPWKVVWTGAATTAVVKAPAGRQCFRAVAVEDGARSPPSPTQCATKQAAS